MTQPLYKRLLNAAAKHGPSAGLEASKERAALFERFAKDAAKRLRCKATDQPAVHYATLQLALELIQMRLIGGKEIDVSSLRWLSEQLDRYAPPPEIPRVVVEIVGANGVPVSSLPRDDPPPSNGGSPPSGGGPAPADSAPQAAAADNVVPFKPTEEQVRRGEYLPSGEIHPNRLPRRRDIGGIHTAVLPNGQPARMVGPSYSYYGGSHAVSIAGPFSVKNEQPPNFEAQHNLPMPYKGVCW